MWHRLVLPVVACLLLAGCSTAEPEVEQDGFVETDTLPSEANATDVHFLGMMVPHHQQAIDMSQVLLDSNVQDREVRDLARRIKDGQEEENQQMLAWAEEWGQDQAMELHSHHLANGMFNPTVLENYRALEGDELRTQFLELMHFHHEQVLDMTEGEVANGGFGPLKDLATQMIEVQTAEMAEMEELLGYVPDL